MKYLGNSKIIKCQCEGSYDKTNISHHRNTMKHKNYELLQKIIKENEKLKKLLFTQNHENNENLQFHRNHENNENLQFTQNNENLQNNKNHENNENLQFHKIHENNE